jgi:ribose/xylose/arabinose/galactoside ABC-type transport system permease subunit
MEKMKSIIEDKIDMCINTRHTIGKYGLFFVFVLICLILSLMSPAFLNSRNLINVIRQISINGILALGVTYVIITGGIDLGLGSYVAFTGCIAAIADQMMGTPSPVPILIGLLAGIIIGGLNGFIITKGKVAPFIVTLGMMTIARGGALLITRGRPVSGLSDYFLYLGNGVILGIPVPIIILAVVLIISIILLNQTKLGLYIYAIGGNEEASRASGIKTNRLKLFVYMLCGALSGLAGIIQAARINTGQPNIGTGYELDAITAVIVGGTSLSGGVGTASGTILGALIIGVINNGLDLLNVSSYYQQVIKGLIIIGAVLLDRKKS